MLRNAQRLMLSVTMLALLFIDGGSTWAGIVDGTFELDGDATESGSVGGDDWGSLFPVHQASASALASVFIADAKNNSCGDATSFAGGGSKDNLDISQWKFTCGKAQDKDEITDAYAALYQQGTNLFLVFGADRLANSGAATIGFWFFQNPVSIITNGPSAGKFSGVHTYGDLLVVSDFTSGGSTSTNRVFKWVGGRNPLVNITTGADCMTAPVGGAVCSVVNGTSIPAPWPYTPKSGSPNTFAPGTFFEGALNISLLVPGEVCFSSFLAETRSSSTINATLSDFAIGRLGTCCIDVTKTPDTVKACPGTPVTYTYVVSNCGAFSLNNVTLVDGVSIQLPSLNSGESITTNLTFAPTGAGSVTNTVTVTGTRGSTIVTASDSAVVTIVSPPPCSITGTNVISCQGQATQFCATNLVGASYSWTGPGGFTASSRCTGTITTPGSYTVTISDSNGCQSTCSRSLTVNQPTTCSITPASATLCQGQTAQFCATNLVGAAYSWTGPSFSANTRCITASAAGTYTVTITDANGCQTSCSATLTVNAPPVCTITGNDTICAGQTTEFCGPAGMTQYVWTGPDGFTGNAQCTGPISAAGQYALQIVDNNGCASTCQRTLTVNSSPVCSITGNNTICGGQDTEFCGPAGMASYSWSGPGGFTANTACTGPISTAGQYTLQIVSDGGCSSSCSRTLTVNAPPPCSFVTQFCAPSVDGASYQWSGPGGFATNTQCTGSISATGTYTVLVIRGDCTNTCQRTLGE